MYRLSVGLGKSVFQPACLLGFEKYGDVFAKIRQHRIILSHRIIQDYLSNVSEDLYDMLRGFLDSISTNEEESISFEDDEKDDFREFIISCVSKVPLGTLVAEKEEFKDCKFDKSKVKLISPADIHNNSRNSITLYSLPVVNLTAKPGEPCMKYCTWLKRWFSGEHKIDIIDGYIFSDRGIRTLKKYYFASMEDGTEVHIYSRITEESDYSSEQEILNAIGSDEQTRLSIFLHFITEYHERYIILPSCQMTIGKGLDFLRLSGTIEDCCSINISAEKDYVAPQESEWQR